MKKLTLISSLTLLSGSALLLTGCGQTGALYLPTAPTTQQERLHSRPMPNSYTTQRVVQNSTAPNDASDTDN